MAYDINKCPTIGESGLVKLAGLTLIGVANENYTIDLTDSISNYTYLIIPFGYSYVETIEDINYTRWYGSTVTFYTNLMSTGGFNTLNNKYTTPDGYEHSFTLKFAKNGPLGDQYVIYLSAVAEGTIHIIGIWGVV